MTGIAIVGLACEYPDAHGPDELWQNVLAQRRAFRRFPRRRLDLADYGSDDRTRTDLTYVREGAFLDGWTFDRVRFRVSGRAFRSADLAHWLALDVAARALADAGWPDGEGLPREAAGVILGNSLTGEFSRASQLRLRWPYVRRTVAAALRAEGRGPGLDPGEVEAFLDRLEGSYKAPFPEMTEESLAGGLSNTIAGRICNHFDLHGGGYTVDGACSSSLLAVAHACSALAAGDLDLALAGGVDLSLDPFELVGFARTGALAEGDMRVFDAGSAGFFPGEGCGFAVLMREDEARALGRRIYAVIRGWGISSDGAGGITRPEEDGQVLALARAYRRAGFGAGSVGYFEGHGTGTAVGDATELGTLARVRRADDPAAPPAAVGSVKALIGHTKAAAGAAGLIKAALALHHRVIPPTAGCREPHPRFAGDPPALRPVREGEPWPAGRPLRAGVSAMGFGGINTHVVLEGEGAGTRRTLSRAERTLLASPQDAEVFYLAAAGRAGLARAVADLAAVAGRLSRAELTDAAAELARRTEAAGGRARAAVVAATPTELEERLGVLAGWLEEGRERAVEPRRGLYLGSGSAAGGAAARAPRIGLLFPGQGAPAHRSGGAWARRFEEVSELYRRVALPTGGADSDTAVAQPSIAAAGLAALAVLERLGVPAAVAVGHSLGELTALCWAGALSEEDLVALAAARGRAMAELGDAGGAMAAIGAGAAAVAEVAAAAGVAVAAHNGPESTVVSGASGDVEAAMAAARTRGWSATRLAVSHAFHSPRVAAARPRLAAAIEAVALGAPRRPVASTVTGALLGPGDDLARLLLDQVTAPVRFAEAVAAAGEVDLWIEAGPGRTLAGLASRLGEAPVISLDAGGDELAGLLAAAGAAWALGAPVVPRALFEDRFARPFSFEREPEHLASPCEAGERPDGIAGAAERAAAARPGVASSASSAAHSGPLEEEGAASAAPPAASAAAGTDPVELLRGLVAARTELPPEAVEPGSRLASDLHLSSISVGQLLADAARRLGRAAPASPTDFADATVAEVAGVLAAGPAAGEEPERQPAGVDSWVRPFHVVWREAPPPRPPAGAAESSGGSAGDWRLIAPPGHPLAAALERELAAAGGKGVALLLSPPPASGCFDDSIDLFVSASEPLLAAAAAGAPGRLLVVHEVGGGGGFARTLFLEAPGTDVCVVDVPFADRRAARWAATEAAAARGYVEARYTRDGRRLVPRAELFRPETGAAEGGDGAADGAGDGRAVELGPDDVLLVTGGGRGIAAECAFELGRRSGAALALIGRSLPEESPELAANLERMRAAGLRVSYQRADVTDAEELAGALAAAEDELGPVTAVLHGAGRNRPKLLAELTADDYRRTIDPKLLGLTHVLSQVDPENLRLLVTFGSIIARTGMRGEADYAVANDWLALATERYSMANPACRSIALEWSVWSGVGMGERLGRLESLIAQGITPIAPERGTALLADLLAAPSLPPALVIAGRWGDPPTLPAGGGELPLARFLERPRVHVPAVELVVECEVGGDTDPYLADHVFRGERLLPAVIGLEAMAQAAAALTGDERLPTFERVELERPVVIADGTTVTLRIAVLERAPGRVDAVLRSGAEGFAHDCFRATLRYGDRPADDAEPERRAAPAGEPLPTGGELYGGLFFHSGRFRRIAGYRELSATACLAEIRADGAAKWFGPWLPGDLRLGDPGARDAALHGIQACVPHSTILPVAVERIVAGRLPAGEPLWLTARERERRGDLFVYDLEVLARDGAVVERWEGLRLRAVSPNRPPAAWSPALLAPWVERRLEELLGGGPHPAVAVEPEPVPGDGAGDRALARLNGGAAVHRRPDGRPESSDGRGVSLAHGAGLVLAVAGEGAVGCDLEPVRARSAEDWSGMLGAERWRLAQRLAGERGEEPNAAATRIWAAAEALRKAGLPAGAPLTLGAAADDGWLLLRSGASVIGTQVMPVAGSDEPLALAVLATVPS